MKLTKAKTENETLLSAIELHRQFIKTKQLEIDSKLDLNQRKSINFEIKNQN